MAENALNFYLFLAFVYLFTYLVGRLVEKIRVPWVFAALLLGFLLAIRNPFAVFTSSEYAYGGIQVVQPAATSILNIDNVSWWSRPSALFRDGRRRGFASELEVFA